MLISCFPGPKMRDFYLMFVVFLGSSYYRLSMYIQLRNMKTDAPGLAGFFFAVVFSREWGQGLEERDFYSSTYFYLFGLFFFIYFSPSFENCFSSKHEIHLWLEGTCKSISVNFLSVISYYHFARRSHWEKQISSLYYFLLLHVNLTIISK